MRKKVSTSGNESFTGCSTSTDRSLSIAALIMMGSVLLSRVIGLFREIVLAKYGGTTFEMDAYVTAFFIPELLNHFLAGGFLSVTFIPVFQKHLVNRREDLAWKAFSNLLCVGTLIFLIVIIVSMYLVPEVLCRLGPQISDTKSFPLTVRLTRIILPAQLLFFWGSLLSAVQMAQKSFFLPALAPLGYNAGIILGGVFLGSRFGIEGFAWGVVGGALIGNFVIQIPGARKCGMRFVPRFDFKDPDLITYFKKTLPLVLGLSMTFSNEVFFRFFGSFLPEGATSSVNYALRTTMMLVAIFGQASGVAFYPFLTRLAAEKKYEDMENLIHSVIKKIAIYLIPLSAVFFVLAQPVIAILYQRGKFSAHSSLETAGVFSVYLLGCFMFSASFIIARAFYAMQKMILPMVVGTATALVTIPMYIFFSRLFDARGIALAAIIGSTLQCGILYSIWAVKHGSGRQVRMMGVLLGKIIFITATGVIAGVFVRELCRSAFSFSPDILQNGSIIICVALPMLLVVFFLFDRFKVQTLKKSLTGLVKRK